MKRKLWITCLAACVLALGLAVAAQVAQEKKTTAAHAASQNQVSYQKMLQSHALTQQMAQNRHAYHKRNQNKTSSRKMTKSGGGNGNGQGIGNGQGGQRSRGKNG